MPSSSQTRSPSDPALADPVLADFPPPPGRRAAGPSERDPWLPLATALESLAEGRADEAWRRLRALGRAPGLDPALRAEAEDLAARALQARGGPRLDLPADFWRPAPGKAFRPPEPDPGSGPWPPVTGGGNDFGFLVEAARRAGLGRPAPRQHLRLVLTLADAAQAGTLAQALARYLAEAPQPPALSLCLLAPAALHGTPMPVPATWQEGRLWRFERDWQVARLCEGADGIVFLPLGALADRFLPDRVARWLALSASLCLPLVPVEGGRTVLSDPARLGGWAGDPDPFPRLRRPAFALAARRFRQMRGFDPRYETELFASRDLLYRLTEAGCYAMPLAVHAELPPTPAADDRDAWLLHQTCPSPALPRGAGRFQRPRLSLCLPLLPGMGDPAAAIGAALDQEFEDLEICLVGGGAEMARLTHSLGERHAQDPRLRRATLHEGAAAACASRALALARGRLNLLMAADERLAPGALSRLVARFEAEPGLGHLRAEGPVRLLMARRQVWARLDPLPQGLAAGVIPELLRRMAAISHGAEAADILDARAPDPRLAGLPAPPDDPEPGSEPGSDPDAPPAWAWLNPRWARAELNLPEDEPSAVAGPADRLELPLALAAAEAAPAPPEPPPPEDSQLRARARALAVHARARAAG